MRVFVTDGDNRAALAVTRSLGRAGHTVIVGERHTPALAQSSRYCAASICYRDPVTDSEGFISDLARISRDQHIDTLLPIADITTFLITRNRERFDGVCRIPFADADTVENVADKVGLMRTAERVGVPVPKYVVVESAAVPAEIPFEFPMVIKPWKSRVSASGKWVSSSVTYARDARELAEDLAGRPAHEFPVMLQERIAGPGMGVFVCYHDGKPVAFFSHRRLRERPPWGGVSVLAESVAILPAARDYAVRLLDAYRWHGVAMVEFKQDLRDGLPKLMEINGRFWGSLQLAVDSGVDFPALLVEPPNGEQQPYKVGVRSRWLWGDFDSLLLTLRSRNGHMAGIGDRAKAVYEFAKFWGHDLHYDNPKWHDLQPWFFETRDRLKLMSRSIRRATGPKGRVKTGSAAVLNRSFRHRIASTLQETGLDEAGWNALAAQSESNSVFQTYQWMRSWCEVFHADYETCLVTVGGHSGVAGVLPLMIDRRTTGERVVRFLSDQRADYCDVLAAGDKAAVVNAAFQGLADLKWDLIELANMPAASRTLELVFELAKRAGYQAYADDQYVCPTLLISGHEAEASDIANKQSLRRRENYFKRAGTLVYRDVKVGAEIAPYLDAFFEQHVSRWKSTETPSLFTDAQYRSFYRQLTRNLADTGWLLFSIVEFNGQPIAFHYGFDYNGSVLWYKPSFDTAYAAHSPGLVMIRHLARYAIEHQRRELDFTVGDEAFKSRFTNATRKTTRIRIYRSRSQYMMDRVRREAVDAARRFIK